MKTLPSRRASWRTAGLALWLALACCASVRAAVPTTLYPSSLPLSGLVSATDGNLYGTSRHGGASDLGAVFKLTPAGVYQVIYSFTGAADGAHPRAALAVGADGLLYGTAQYGGTQNGGTIFKLTTAGVFTALHSLVAATEGAEPVGGLVFGTDGKIYGAASYGGTSGAGTLFQITTSGSFAVLHQFSGANGRRPLARLVAGADGLLYGTTESGGSSEFGTVFSLTTAGTFASLFSFTGANGKAPRAMLVQGADTAFYGTTAYGGTSEFGSVFKITPGGVFTSLTSMTGDGLGATPLSGLALGGDGNFYGSATHAGTNGFGVVYKLASAGGFTALNAFTGNADGGNPETKLALGANGSLYGTTALGGTNNGGTVFELATPSLAPTITGVTGPTAGSYKAGQSLSFTVNFSTAVTVTGSPQLPLTVGSTARNATYASGSPGTALVFTYTVQAMETDTDGIVAASPLVLNGGTIKNGATDAGLTFTPPTTTTVLVDTTAPTISIGAPSVAVTANANGPVTYTVTYADANFNASSLAVGNISLNTSGNATGTVTVDSGTGTTRTVTISNITGNGTLGISIASGTASDAAGNLAAAAGPSTTFIVDNTPPTISLSAPSASSTSTGPITYTVTYADANFNTSTLAVGNITLNKTGTANGTVTVDGGMGATRTVTISSITGSGTLGITIAAGTATDLAGSLAPASSASTTFTVDGVPPSISISAPSASSATTGPIIYTVTYADAAFNTSTLTAGNVTLNTTGNATGTVTVDGGTGAVRTLTISGITGTGTLGITIAAGTASDLVGNLAPASSASTTFTVAPVPAGGAPYAWGKGVNGQLGNNGTVNSSVPVAVDVSGVLAGKTITAVVVGGSHSLALTSQGKVYAWGSGTGGTLGNNATTDSSVPVAVDVSGVLAGKTVTAVAAGNGHSLALTSDGKVYSWGLGSSGRLGNNGTVNSLVPVAVDMSGVLAGKLVTAISAGGTHCLVLTSEGRMYAWGSGSNGKLGNNATLDSSVPVAVDVSGVLAGKIVKAIAASGGYNLALTSDGQVYAWGGGSTGQLGNNTTTATQSVPVAVDLSGVLAGKTVTAIAAGGTHCLALTSDGKVYAWGNGAGGALGNNGTAVSSLPVVVDASGVLAGKTVTAIAAGNGHSLALASDGQVYAWGTANFGQLGNNSNSQSLVPVAVDVSGVLAGQTVTALAPGGIATHSLVVAIPPPAPAITSVTGPTAGSYKAGQNLSFTVNFSTAVTVTGVPQLPLTVGSTARNATYASGSPGTALVFTYTVQALETDTDGIVAASPLVLNGGTIKLGVVDATLTFTPPTTTSVLVDTTAPTISIGAPSASSTASGPITYTVTYADAATVTSSLAVGDITLNKTGTANGTVTVDGGTGATRTVTISSITGNGTLGITIAAGTASDVAGNTAPASSASTTFTVIQPNAAPTVASAIPNFSLNEDAANVVTNLTAVFADTETPATSLSYAVVANTNSGLVTATITSLTNLTLALAANSNGTSLISVSATDAGGLAVTNTFLLTVNPVNDAPGVTFAQGTVTVTEDLGAQTVPGFATFSPGPANESAQTLLGYTVTVNNPGLFSAAPAINNSGVLTFASAANSNGTATVTVLVQDSGGTASGGVDKATNTFTITVTPVNDAPTLVLATNVVMATGDGTARTMAGFATFVAGPADETGQTLLGYTVTVDNATLFSVAPAVAANGTLTFTPARGTNGATMVTVVARDSGGTASGGVDRATRTFTLVVRPAPGYVDTSVTPTANGAVYAAVPQPDGKILIGGTFSTFGGVARQNLARLNANGTVDTGFTPTVPGGVTLLTVQADGSILVGGFFTSISGTARQNFARLNADGTVAAGFNPAPNGTVYAVLEQADGKILLAGEFTQLGGSSHTYLGRLLPDGTVDATYAPVINASVYSIALQADGSLLVGGAFTQVNGSTRTRLARLDASGNLDAAYAPAASGNVFCLAVAADGKGIVAGGFGTLAGASRQNLGRLNTDGSIDTGFNPGVGGTIYTLAQQADGQLVIGGSISTVGGQTRRRVARVTAAGALDISFDPNLNADAYGVALQGDGKVLVGGPFTTVGGNAQSGFAELLNEAATQSLTVVSSSQVAWQRGGTAPEALGTTFELSTDAGATWTALGAGVRVAGGWQRTGLSLPGAGLIRARARVPSSQQGGSVGLVETIVPFPNTAPTAAGALPDLVLNENAAPVITSMAAAFSDLETASTNLAFSVVANTNLALLVAEITQGTNLTLSLVHGQNGSSQITVRATDGGGLVLDRTFQVTVNPVNSPPTIDFTAKLVAVAQNSGAQSRAGFASFSVGPPDEAGQTLLGITVANDLPGLFATVPAVAADGTLSFTPATGMTGSAVVSVVAQDNGGTASGGQDRATNTFTLRVVPANQVVTSSADSGPGSLRQVLLDANAAGLPFTLLVADGVSLPPPGSAWPAITVSATFVLGSGGAINGTVTVGSGGTLNLAGGTFTGMAITVQNGGTLTGSGSFTGTLVVDPGGIVTPGNSPGTIQADAGIWAGGGNYVWEINDATGAAGTASDLLVFTGTLTITATPADPFTVKLRTLGAGGSAGPMAGFDPATAQTWTIARAGDVSGFAAAAIRLDTNEVANPLATGVFGIQLSGGEVQITFTPNLPPTVPVPPTAIVVQEDASSTVVQLATLVTDPEQASAQLTYQVTANTAPGLVTPTLGSGGALTLAYTANASGSAFVTVRATDAGGLFVESTLSVTVNPVNDAPSVSFAQNTVTVLEDAGAQALASFATFSPGPPNESAQTLVGYTVMVDNAALFTTAPAIGNNGQLTFTTAANSNGTATVTVVVQDSGGTASGGVDKSTNTFTISVTPVNDAPSVTFAQGTVTVLEDAGAQALASFATFSPGPANESAQTLVGYTVTVNNAGLFSVAPAIDNNGQLTFTAAANSNGTAVVTVVVQDSGGTGLAPTTINSTPSAVDKSTNTFTISVTPVNDAPSVTFAQGTVTVLEDAGAQSVSSFATFSPGPANESAQTLVGYTVTVNNAALFSTAPAIDNNGRLTFTPAANANGSATVSVVVQDDGGTGLAPTALKLPPLGGGADKSTNTFVINVTAVNDAPSFALPSGTSLPAGATLTARESNRYWSAIASSADGTKLAAVEYGGMIYTSVDSGVTWTAQAGAGARDWFSIASSADGTKLAAADDGFGSGGLIYTSVDSGVTWTAQASGSYNWSRLVSSADGTKLAASVNGGHLYISTDSGVTWTEREAVRTWNSISISADGTKLVAVDSGDQNGGLIYTSADSGVTWTPQPSAGSRYWLSTASSADGLKLVAVNQPDSGALAIYTSTDGGATWTGQAGSPLLFRPYAIASSADGTKLVVVDGGLPLPFSLLGGYIYTSVDSGVTWTERSSAGSRFWVSVAASADGAKLAVVENGGQIYTSYSYVQISGLTVLEDAGAQSIAGFVTSVSPGPADEAGQTVGFTLLNDNPALFSAPPALAPNGTLTYTPAANANGSALVTIVAQDNGGTDNGGVDQATNTFLILVTAVNDAPSVTFAQGTVTVAEDAGAQTLGGFATFSPGPANESAQFLYGYFVSVDNPSLFRVAPDLDYSGALTFTPAANANGSATVTVVVVDDGPFGDTHMDRSTNTFTIVVRAINDAPVANPDSYSMSQGDVLLVGGLMPAGAGPVRTGVLANDTDIENDALTATKLTDPAHGTMSLNANGGFTYTPDTNFFGTDTFTYRASDYGSNSNPATVSILVLGRPTNAVPLLQRVFSSTVLRFSATNAPDANPIRVGDPDSTALTVSLTVSNGVLTITNVGPLTFVDGTTNGTNLVFTGLQADLNAALEGLTYLSKTNYFGDDTLVIVSMDEGGRTNRGYGLVPLLVEIPALGGVPKVSLDNLNDPMTGRMITNVTMIASDTNLVKEITFNPTNSEVNVLAVGGQDGSTNRSTITVKVKFSDGTEQDVVVPVIIYQPLLTSTTNEGAYNSTFGTPIFNPQTSLYEQKVSVVNNTPFDFTALRITATNLPAGVSLRNASVTNGGLPYIEYNLAVRAGSNVTLTLEYYNANRAGAFTPGLKLELLNSSRVIPPPTNPVMTAVIARRGYAPDGRIRFYIEFPTEVGLTYYVQYQDAVGDPWKTSPVIIPGTGNRLNWLDEGAPNTDSPPTAARFYRIVTGN